MYIYCNTSFAAQSLYAAGTRPCEPVWGYSAIAPSHYVCLRHDHYVNSVVARELLDFWHLVYHTVDV